MEQNDLSKRLFEFAVKMINFLRTLPNEPEYKVIKYQLIKSCTFTGANYDKQKLTDLVDESDQLSKNTWQNISKNEKEVIPPFAFDLSPLTF